MNKASPELPKYNVPGTPKRSGKMLDFFADSPIPATSRAKFAPKPIGIQGSTTVS
jgi:hypothetical protein